ncbi:predicted protein [Nematostella vectensis]|uniref:Tetraspanin-13 n=1 Tax=Nematostella vectensis TaxID=45351 RepID=A7RGH7_NEMVE|nr:predicted protein [Nematostella vectensis]|eukprot:XP_001641493.1 predicted protein [Nematostella vectensis]
MQVVGLVLIIIPLYSEYMAILVLIFIILFSISVAALSMSSSQEKLLLEKGWAHLSPKSRTEVQKISNCCGLENMNITDPSSPGGHPTCAELDCCSQTKTYSCPKSCQTCFSVLKTQGLEDLKKEVGGVGLFFSFTLFIGVYAGFRFRHLKDPRANPSAFL